MSTEISPRKELQPSNDVISFCTGHSPTPNPFCFDCAFLPEPHKLCLIHSLQQEKRDLVLEDGERSGKGAEKEEKEEAGPQPILHSTPQAGELQLVVAGLHVLYCEWAYNLAVTIMLCYRVLLSVVHDIFVDPTVSHECLLSLLDLTTYWTPVI